MKLLRIALPLIFSCFLTSMAFAHHAPSAYCSESGDVCNSTGKVNGVRKFRIGTAAHYFRKYKVCVRAPDSSRACRTGKMRDGNDDGIWEGAMKWRKRFPYKGRGAYNVRWYEPGGYKSPKLGFHVRRRP
jgi:hypothetical protein